MTTQTTHPTPPTIDEAAIDGLIERETAIVAPPLTPELRMHGAADYARIWSATEAGLDALRMPPPFWAFAWAGGQALARFILDNRQRVARRRVVALAAGGGLEAIAALKAGAVAAVGNDVDAFARRAMTLNATLNGVTLETCGVDWLAENATPDADMLIAGDIFYERAIAEKLWPLLTVAAKQGVEVWVGDAGRPYKPEIGVTRLARYRVPTPIDLEDADHRIADVLRVEP